MSAWVLAGAGRAGGQAGAAALGLLHSHLSTVDVVASGTCCSSRPAVSRRQQTLLLHPHVVPPSFSCPPPPHLAPALPETCPPPPHRARLPRAGPQTRCRTRKCTSAL